MVKKLSLDEKKKAVEIMVDAGITPQQRLLTALKTGKTSTMSQARIDNARKMLAKKKEILQLAVDHEHTEKSAQYIMDAHKILGGVNLNEKNLDVFLKAASFLDDLKKKIFNETQPDRAKSITNQVLIQQSADLNPDSSKVSHQSSLVSS